MPPNDGMTVNQLIAQLQRIAEKNGDAVVYMSGNDYPEPVNGVFITKVQSPYIPKGSVKFY